jgi:2-keto-3-deoxy-6-phosphogluconate aldolase
MDKQKAKELLRNKIIAVIRCDDFSKAKLISNTIIESGIDVLEITFSVKDWSRKSSSDRERTKATIRTNSEA